jgi:hypothetical protein
MYMLYYGIGPYYTCRGGLDFMQRKASVFNITRMSQTIISQITNLEVYGAVNPLIDPECAQIRPRQLFIASSWKRMEAPYIPSESAPDGTNNRKRFEPWHNQLQQLTVRFDGHPDYASAASLMKLAKPLLELQLKKEGDGMLKAVQTPPPACSTWEGLNQIGEMVPWESITIVWRDALVDERGSPR